MEKIRHLHESCISTLNLSIEERIMDIANPRWIGYPLAHEILHRFEDLLRHPRVARMPNLMLIGRTNNGKTELLKKFCQRHAPDLNSNGCEIIAPVMYIQAPPTPNEADLYSGILSSLYERVPATSTSAKRTRVIEVLKRIGTKVICMDEVHNALAGSSTKQQQFLNSLKYLSNELQISFIITGTEDLLRAVSVDNQIQNRFEPILLPKWKMNKEYRQLLMTFESILPLKHPSQLHSGLICKKLLALSEGTIGELSTLLKKATIFAIRNEVECIDEEVISRCGYVSPQDRTKELTYNI